MVKGILLGALVGFLLICQPGLGGGGAERFCATLGSAVSTALPWWFFSAEANRPITLRRFLCMSIVLLR